MMSFRVDAKDAAAAVQRWAESLGVDRSELLREALRLHLDRLASEGDGERWADRPLDEGEPPVGPGSPNGVRRRTGLTGVWMQRGEIWFAATPGGDRPVLVLTRDPVADRMGSVVVAALTRTRPRAGVRTVVDRVRRRADRQRHQLRQHPHDPSWHLPPEGDFTVAVAYGPTLAEPSRRQPAADEPSDSPGTRTCPRTRGCGAWKRPSEPCDSP